MIRGLKKIPSGYQIDGFPFGVEAFGTHVIDVSSVSELHQGQIVTPSPAITPDAMQALAVSMGTRIGTFSGDLPELVVPVDSNVRILELFAMDNDGLTMEVMQDNEFFNVPTSLIPASNVRILWESNTAVDFGSYELYWDSGIPELTNADFYNLASVEDQKQTHYPVTDLDTGTYRFFMRIKDRYGNIGPTFASITPVSVTITAPPTLAGSFVFDDTDETVDVSFNITASANVVDTSIFINYAYSYGLLETINYNHPYTKYNLPRALPLGRILLAAVGFDKYGFPTEPILTTCIVMNDGTEDVLYDDFLTPINVTTETLISGDFKLRYENINPGWTSLDYEIVDADLDPVSDGNTTGPSGVTIDPGVADGAYLFRIRAKYVNVVTIYGEWSAYVDLLIDSTAPTGNTITVEKVL